jgi:hypothetical protein
MEDFLHSEEKVTVQEPEVLGPGSELDAALAAARAVKAQGPRFSSLDRFDPVPPIVSGARVTQEGVQVAPRVIGGIDVEPGTPLAYLLDLMEARPDMDYSPEQRLYHERMRLEAAKAALPAIHPRLAQVELNGKLGLTHEQALEELEKGPV